MKILVDDWHFKSAEGDSLRVDLYLLNGQHALLEIHPMKETTVPHGEVPEMVVLGEMPGEHLDPDSAVRRWVARPPHRDCEWSRVEISPTLLRQVHDRLHNGLVES